METSLELFDYGIHNEASNIRAHVAVLAKSLYVFPTVCAVRIMNKYPVRNASQDGVNGFTAQGHCVPPLDIPNIRKLLIKDERLSGFLECLTTTEKGDRAVKIVADFLKGGRFPLWLEGEFVSDKQIQITGTDMLVKGQWKIEIKCDYRASDKKGVPHERCTGNLYLQTKECNPRKFF